jgi:hypothetical protein
MCISFVMIQISIIEPDVASTLHNLAYSSTSRTEKRTFIRPTSNYRLATPTMGGEARDANENKDDKVR